jgi:hypothetical protein
MDKTLNQETFLAHWQNSQGGFGCSMARWKSGLKITESAGSSTVLHLPLDALLSSWDIEILDKHHVIAFFVVDQLIDELFG